MLTLAHSGLEVDVLDPVADCARLGGRFCWGGYVWQARDSQAGALLAGPEWPAEPAPHNGQGLPESFRHSTTRGEPLLWRDGVGLAPGAGMLERTADGAIAVREPCTWKIDSTARTLRFRTAQRVLDWSYELQRTIEIEGRTLRSTSRLTNRGSAQLALEWFAHPFFALDAGLGRATLPPGIGLADNPGFVLDRGEFSFRRKFDSQHDGHLDHFLLPPGLSFSARLAHPRLTHLDFSTDFAPFKCVVWANDRTLSFEPFLTLQLAPGEGRTWGLRYDFGPSR